MLTSQRSVITPSRSPVPYGRSVSALLLRRLRCELASSFPRAISYDLSVRRQARRTIGRTTEFGGGEFTERTRRRLRGAADWHGRRHGSRSHLPVLPLPRGGHGRPPAGAPVRVVQRPAARHLPARARSRQGGAAGRGARGARGDRERASSWRHGGHARRSADVLDPALRERGGPVRQEGGPAQTRRARSPELNASTTITIATVTRRTVEAAG